MTPKNSKNPRTEADPMKAAQAELAAKRKAEAQAEDERRRNDPPPGEEIVATLEASAEAVEALRREAFEAFAKAQSEFETITFDKENPHFHNKYASLKATLKATLPALNKHGISLMTQPRLSGENIIADTVLVYKGYTFAKGEWLVGKATATQQQTGSSLTYARRYTTQSILGVAAEDDDDGEATTNHNTPTNGTTKNPSASAAADALGF